MASASEQLDPAILALLPSYLANRRKDIDLLADLVAAKKYEDARRIGHNIKGSGGSYGLTDFSEVGHRIERAALANDAKAILAEIEALKDCANRLSKSL